MKGGAEQSRPPAPVGPLAAKYGSAWEALRANWRLYLMEGAELGIFMLSACVVDLLLFHPGYRLAGWNPWVLRGMMGSAMGVTAVGIIESPWGRKSGAQFNPAITATFYRLGKIGPYDACWYAASHFVGAVVGVGVARLLMGQRLADGGVRYAVTVPGIGGVAGAFAAECGMGALLMGVVLVTSGRPRLAGYTTYCVGVLIACYVLVLAPVSGFSINPARTVGSAVFARVWTAVWVYFTAPVLGMLGVAEVYVRWGSLRAAPAGVRHYLKHRHVVQRNG